MYKKANEKLEQELDVVNLVKSIRILRLMSKVILPQRSRMLLKFSRRNLIETTTSSSDSDYNKYDTMKLLDNKNNFVKLWAMMKINRNLDYFKGKDLDKNDRHLLKGLFERSPKEEDIKVPVP